MPADVARGAEFLAGIAAYNVIEYAVCSQTPNCSSDRGALLLWQFGTQDIATVTNTGGVDAFPFNLPVLAPMGSGAIPNSTGDYWHPTLQGQAKIAAVEWQAFGLGDDR